MTGAVASPHLIDYIMENGKAGGACINVRTAVCVVPNKYTIWASVIDFSVSFLAKTQYHMVMGGP